MSRIAANCCSMSTNGLTAKHPILMGGICPLNTINIPCTEFNYFYVYGNIEQTETA
jgi:hypothetical protein